MSSNDLQSKTAVLYSSDAPNEEQERRFRNFIKTRYGEDCDFRWERSDAFPGGFRLEVGQEVYDWSVGGRFQQLRDTLVKVPTRNGNIIPLIKETIRTWTPEALAQAMLELQRIGAENINLVTPTPHVDGILTAIDRAKADGLTLPIVYNTNGYLSVDTVDKLRNHVDIWLPDFKYHDQRLADRFSAAPHYFETALAAIGRMLESSGQLELDETGRAKKGVLIRHLVLPACVYDTRDVLLAVRDHFGVDTYLSLMHQFTPQPDGKAPLNRRLTKREYENAVSACLDLGFTRVYIQEAVSATFAYTPEFSSEVSVQP